MSGKACYGLAMVMIFLYGGALAEFGVTGFRAILLVTLTVIYGALMAYSAKYTKSV